MPRLEAIGLVLVLLAALWLRVPHITAGLPFIYDEDEAHHHNRVVEMVKEGRFNPKYFNKPSLHFYLRMPVVAAAFVWSAKAGEIRQVRQIRTRAAGAAGGYAFTASHPRILAWNRALTVVFSVLAVLLTFLIARELTGSFAVALGAAWLAAWSPALVADSAKIGVDTPLVFMCLLAMLLAIRLHARFSLPRLLAAGLVAGLAFSTKYNAIPILLLPLVACLLTGHRSPPALILAVAAPVAGFLAGSPFAIVELPLFLDQMSYEAFHYGTLGHRGGIATGDPGLPQAWFYLRWLARSAIGVIPVALAIGGLAVLAARRDRRAATFLLFPLLFFLLMVDQRVNFVRNVLVLIPVLAVLATAAIAWMAGRFAAGGARRIAAAALFAAAAAQPLAAAWGQRSATLHRPIDSRQAAADWVLGTVRPHEQVAVAAELQMQPDFIGRGEVTELPFAELDPVRLFQDGYDRVLVGRRQTAPPRVELLRQEKVFEGRPRREDRFPADPRLVVFRIEPLTWSALEQHRHAAEHTVRLDGRPDGSGGCYAGAADDLGWTAVDGGCWVRGRLTRLEIDALAVEAATNAVPLSFEVRTPHLPQSCAISRGGWRSPDLCVGLASDRWQRVSVEVPADVARAGGPWLLHVDRIGPLPPERRRRAAREPAGPRRAGIAIRTPRHARQARPA